MGIFIKFNTEKIIARHVIRAENFKKIGEQSERLEKKVIRNLKKKKIRIIIMFEKRLRGRLLIPLSGLNKEMVMVRFCSVHHYKHIFFYTAYQDIVFYSRYMYTCR